MVHINQISYLHCGLSYAWFAVQSLHCIQWNKHRYRSYVHSAYFKCWTCYRPINALLAWREIKIMNRLWIMKFAQGFIFQLINNLRIHPNHTNQRRNVFKDAIFLKIPNQHHKTNHNPKFLMSISTFQDFIYIFIYFGGSSHKRCKYNFKSKSPSYGVILCTTEITALWFCEDVSPMTISVH